MTTAGPATTGGHVLVVRLDSLGDMVVCGPAVRAVTRHADRVTVLAGPRGAAAAALLPGVDDVLTFAAPWILSPAPPVDAAALAGLVDAVARRGVDAALVLTSFHQSALPTALALRLAGVARIAAVSTDHAGSLLDVRLPEPGDDPEPVRMATIAAGAGYPADPSDDGRLALRDDLPASPVPGPYLVVHPGADAPARAYPAARMAAVVSRLRRAGHRVVVTGGADETDLTAAVSGRAPHAGPGPVLDLGGRLDLPQLAAVLRGARALVAGNTGPAHVAAAVGTPVVSLFSPVVPAVRWAPHGVDRVLLGDPAAACAGSRARECPVPGHPCLASVDPDDVVAAALRLAGAGLEVPA